MYVRLVKVLCIDEILIVILSILYSLFDMLSIIGAYVYFIDKANTAMVF
ncbi:hypothetical protein EHRUM3_00720 [Ehrlichia ruminantium]|uniref:Uncharacterized protein n=1 Tax=Ehrlichia ruminantium TaxID=779 RepID=A0A170SC66_EHRRU|nr:hypothetical protein EHRUM3_00720 [Ehrlichia ruminantium]